MSPSEIAIAQGMSLLLEIYGKTGKLSDTAMDAYTELLCDLSPAALWHGFKLAAKECVFFPSVAEIRVRAAAYQPSEEEIRERDQQLLERQLRMVAAARAQEPKLLKSILDDKPPRPRPAALQTVRRFTEEDWKARMDLLRQQAAAAGVSPDNADQLTDTFTTAARKEGTLCDTPSSGSE